MHNIHRTAVNYKIPFWCTYRTSVILLVRYVEMEVPLVTLYFFAIVDFITVTLVRSLRARFAGWGCADRGRGG